METAEENRENTFLGRFIPAALAQKAMVGGQFALYRGIIFLDAGIFTSALANYPAVTIVIYIAVINVFAGVVYIQ